MGNIWQGISLKLLKSLGRQLCEDSIRRLTSHNVRLTFMQSAADHFMSQTWNSKVLLYFKDAFFWDIWGTTQNVKTFAKCLTISVPTRLCCYHWLLLKLVCRKHEWFDTSYKVTTAPNWTAYGSTDRAALFVSLGGRTDFLSGRFEIYR